MYFFLVKITFRPLSPHGKEILHSSMPDEQGLSVKSCVHVSFDIVHDYNHRNS